jgi:hypothetical protein
MMRHFIRYWRQKACRSRPSTVLEPRRYIASCSHSSKASESLKAKFTPINTQHNKGISSLSLMKKVASLQSSHNEQSIVEAVEMVGILSDAGMASQAHPLLKSLVTLILDSPQGGNEAIRESMIIDVIYAATTTNYVDDGIMGK